MKDKEKEKSAFDEELADDSVPLNKEKSDKVVPVKLTATSRFKFR